MPIAGAIFDCDGTLIDSMPLWNQVFRDLVAAHGGTLTDEQFDEGEPLSADEECAWLHDSFGIGESTEALTAELRALVRDAYATRIDAWPGVHTFLNELRAAGVPMVIATSTPADDVAIALAANGLDGYFADVIFAGDVGRGKEFPDVYLAACKRLGTSIANTWVFEDAPFGLVSARGAGFRTVCVYNDHDGRDETFCRTHADILVHGYAELSRALLDDFALAPGETHGILRALVVAGSPEPSVATVTRLAAASDYVVAADAGAGHCRRAGVVPDAWVGDADSVTDKDSTWARINVATVIGHPTEKYATDLSLAVECARHEAARRNQALALTVTCASGGRPDHALGVLGVLAENADTAPCLIEDCFECRVLSGDGTTTWALDDAVGATFSAIPLAGAATVSERGMRWELDHRTLGALSDRGVSNIITATDAAVTCHAGTLACFLLHRRDGDDVKRQPTQHIGRVTTHL